MKSRLLITPPWLRNITSSEILDDPRKWLLLGAILRWANVGYWPKADMPKNAFLEFVDVCVAPTSNMNLKIRAPQAMPTTTATTILRMGMRMRSLVIWLLSLLLLTILGTIVLPRRAVTF